PVLLFQDPKWCAVRTDLMLVLTHRTGFPATHCVPTTRPSLHIIIIDGLTANRVRCCSSFVSGGLVSGESCVVVSYLIITCSATITCPPPCTNQPLTTHDAPLTSPRMPMLFQNVTAATISGAFVFGMVLVLLESIRHLLVKRLNLNEAQGEWLLAVMHVTLIPMMLLSGLLID